MKVLVIIYHTNYSQTIIDNPKQQVTTISFQFRQTTTFTKAWMDEHIYPLFVKSTPKLINL